MAQPDGWHRGRHNKLSADSTATREKTQPSPYTWSSHARPHVAIALFQSENNGTKRGGVIFIEGNGVIFPGGGIGKAGVRALERLSGRPKLQGALEELQTPVVWILQSGWEEDSVKSSFQSLSESKPENTENGKRYLELFCTYDMVMNLKKGLLIGVLNLTYVLYKSNLYIALNTIYNKMNISTIKRQKWNVPRQMSTS